ncbi:MAG: hypothetical protein JXA64_05700 [Candidatus Fermentibacteraceae bacterium]|nr:hypothetical protein [Candidatus Fermentibacteraceae bacterium]MBN2608591.1 hypothetical protein [Candidatus Fermentibacteraceae bacterium]
MRSDLSEGGILFQERYAMAQSQKNVWTKMVSTWKCIVVSLSSTNLQIGLHGLFGLLVKPFGADLEHTVPLTCVISAEKKGRLIGYDEISLVFSLPSGGRRELLLYLKRGEEFLSLLNSLRTC